MTNEGSFVGNKNIQFRHGGRVLKSYITQMVLRVVLIAVTTVIASAAGQTANAQQVVASAAGQTAKAQEKKVGLVTVLDVARVFKENQSFDSQMKAIKGEADRLKANITQEQEAIKQRAQRVTQYELGSTERNRLEAELEQEQTALRTKARQAEADLLNREARVYYETYQKMQSVVSSVAAQNGIALVLRFDSEDIDPTNRGEVIKGVNRAVVYHRQLDLTAMVSNAMNPAQARNDTGTQNK